VYPQRDLNRLANYKAALRQDIGRHRAQCAKSAARIAQPFELLDRALTVWRRIRPLAPIAALPLAFLVQRTVFPGLKFVRPLLRWAPLVFTAFRSVRSIRKTTSKS